ncbi:methyltransferase domain-containing protein [Ditylenchus destructor]|nr:methyltransferase domain-containing protein [Ditylenchus destructor]
MSTLQGLIPKSHRDFTDPQYWKKFFEKYEKPFEWYGSYDQLHHVMEKYIKISDSILELGCGNSELAEKLYDNGFRHYRGIDTDSKVIQKQTVNNSTKRPELAFECKSVTENGAADESTNVVIDKGTLDALLQADASEDDKQTVRKMFEEVERCLTPMGRYIIITLAQMHLVDFLLEYFLAKNRFHIRIHKCGFAEDGQKGSEDMSKMPVFAVVITKFRVLLNPPPKMEFVLPEAEVKPIRVDGVDELKQFIMSSQELNWFRHYTKRNIIDEASITLCDTAGKPRYTLTVVDDRSLKQLNTYSVFIVPRGRESDWLFASKKGRQALRAQCKKDRLVVVNLDRKQEYFCLQGIQNDLQSIVVAFEPIGISSKQIEFLSLGAVDLYESLARGTSEMSGAWTVEQVEMDEHWYRRLIFDANPALIQSEVEVIKSKRGKWQVKSDFLTCDHHRKMLLAIEFLDIGKRENILSKAGLRFAVLGVGGGLLPRFLYEQFTQAFVVGVELDPEILTVGHKYFGLPKENARLKLIVDDALNFLEQSSKCSKDEEKFDVIFMDLAASTAKNGLSCPPPAFITESALENMKKSLKSRGVLAFNLVTRDEDISKEVKSTVERMFSLVGCGEEDVNEVLICPKDDKDSPDWVKNYSDDLEKLTLSNEK